MRRDNVVEACAVCDCNKVYTGGAVPGDANIGPAPVGTDGKPLWWADVQPPRTIGVTLGANF